MIKWDYRHTKMNNRARGVDNTESFPQPFELLAD